MYLSTSTVLDPNPARNVLTIIVSVLYTAGIFTCDMKKNINNFIGNTIVIGTSLIEIPVSRIYIQH